MERIAIDRLSQAVAAAEQAAVAGDLDGCDLDDLEQIVAPVRRELQRPLPNARTLASFLNSLARSLRSDQRARKVVLELDAAMRQAGIPTDWEH